MSIIWNENPTYGELLDFLQAAEIACETDSEKHSVADILTEKFTFSYPHIPISHPT